MNSGTEQYENIHKFTPWSQKNMANWEQIEVKHTADHEITTLWNSDMISHMFGPAVKF